MFLRMKIKMLYTPNMRTENNYLSSLEKFNYKNEEKHSVIYCLVIEKSQQRDMYLNLKR